MHKATKSIMHVWISLASIAVFGFGWAVFAHSAKPAPLAVEQQPSINVVVPTLAPIPSIDELVSSSSSSQSTQFFQNPTFSAPRLRARGS
jgi:hypothetical protein